jgi:hypothetical protein
VIPIGEAWGSLNGDGRNKPSHDVKCFEADAGFCVQPRDNGVIDENEVRI